MELTSSLTTLESSGLIRLAQVEPELEYLQKAYDRVMLVAGNIQDPELHQSWLENAIASLEVQLLRIASVIGRQFSVKVLEQVV